MMQPEEVTVTVQKATLASLSDAISLIEWTQTIPGVGCSVTGTVDGNIIIQLDGTHIPTAYATIGDTVTWDGTKFVVTNPEAQP